MSNSILFLLPLIGALIGWLTNTIAVRMLFRPRREKRFFGLRLHGVLPRRQRALAEKVGEIVARELFSSEDMRDQILNNTESPDVTEALENAIGNFLEQKLPSIIPMVAMVLVPEVLESLKKTLATEIQAYIPHVLEKLVDSDTGNLNVQKLVEERVSAFSTLKMEELLLSIMKREFRFIEVIGGVLGFLIGLIQAAIVHYGIPQELEKLL